MRTWPAPAKLNLFLHVVGRRADGYHELQTVFQFLDQADQLSFRLRTDGQILRTSGPAAIPATVDLCVRAAQALQKAAQIRLGVEIDIIKRIPWGAGLGGGSSDAATTLVALNRLWRCGWSVDELAQLGLWLGADVPVFVRGQAAWGEGVGERLTPLQLPQPWYLVITPPCQVSTAEVFGDPELTRDTPKITISDFLAGQGHNDCLPVVRRHYPPVAQALDWLTAQGAQARLTGTGASVFAAFADQARAQELLMKLPTGFSGLVTQGRNRSALLDALADWDDSGCSELG